MSILFRVSVAVVALLISGVAFAEDPALKLMALLKPIKNISANFQQQSLDKSGKKLQQQSGHFVVKSSGEFYWYVKPPYEQQIISDGKVINIYDPDLEQLTIKTLDPKAQMIPLLLFSENGQKIITQYRVSQREAGTSIVFELKPNSDGSLFDQLVITFSSHSGVVVPTQLEIVDTLKQSTLVEFDKLLLNQSTDPNTFVFSAPEGVDVIDERH